MHIIYRRSFVYNSDLKDTISVILEDNMVNLKFTKDFLNQNDENCIEESNLLDYYEQFTPFKNDSIFTLHRLKEDINLLLDELDEKYKEITEKDIDDDRIIALMKHLDISPKEALEEIEENGTNYYTYENQEYLVLTDSEADDKEYDCVKFTIEDCYLPEIVDSPAYHYVDVEKWAEDWCGSRGENISSYDGTENEEDVNNITYYIYRTN